MSNRELLLHLRRHSCYSLLLLALYTLGRTPGLWPFGAVRPCLLIPYLVCLALWEGEMIGALYGMFAGLLLDMGSFAPYGFFAILLLVFGCACGLVGAYLLRPRWQSALALTLFGAGLYFGMSYLLHYGIWSLPDRGLVLWGKTLPRIALTVLFALPLYPLIQRLSAHFRARAQALLGATGEESLASIGRGI